MAFLTEYAGESDPGKWFVIRKAIEGDGERESEPEVRLRIRRIPKVIAERFELRYGKEEQVRREGGMKVPQRVYTLEESSSLVTDKGAYAWTECEGLTIEPADEDAVEIWKKLLGLDSMEVGQTYEVPRTVPETVKRRLFGLDALLALWIVRRSESVMKKQTAKEEDFEGN